MKVIHIIPSAFNYFDDIRAAAFGLIEKLDKFGVDSVAFTLQYNSVISTRMKDQVRTAAPSQTFAGMSTLDNMFDELSNADIVHVHTPLFGGMGQFFAWRANNPTVPVVLTYYRPCALTNLFSYFIYAYNWYYLSRLVGTATVNTLQALSPFVKSLPGVQFLPIDSSNTLAGENLTEILDGVQLTVDEIPAAKYAVLYQDLLDT